MGRPLTTADHYTMQMHLQEPCTRLNPVQEERLREAIRHVELECFRREIPHDYPRLLDVWVTKTPPAGRPYAAAAHLILRARPHARVRAKRRTIWWLPWRRGGGRG